MKLVSVTQTCGRVPVTVIRLEDRLNLGNTEEVEQAAKGAYAAGGRNMILDLSKVPSLTSAGIRTILGIYKMLAEPKEAGKHLKLVGPIPAVREVLDIAGLIKFIEIYGSLDEAVASF
jgi:anti-sigma B factor antagonist